ncbi:MAG: hypothetical protein WCW29_04310 [Candidatus Paceibacterota bacterium]|jgi:hypothetical protein
MIKKISKNIVNETMGNQQETISDIEKSWLAGILDGEGSIGISRLMSHRKNPTLTPRISIGNTNMKIINHVREILEKIPITMFIEKCQKVENKNWKQASVIQISHIIGVKKLLDVVTPFLIGKREQAEILLSFVNSRIKIYKSLNRIPGNGGRGTPYTDEEIKLCYQLKILNKKGIK